MKANDITFKNNKMRISYFIRTSVLIEFTKSDSNKLIKLKGMITSIKIPEFQVKNYIPRNNKYKVLVKTVQSELDTNLLESSMYENSEDNINESRDIFLKEENNLISNKILEDNRVLSSDNENDLF